MIFLRTTGSTNKDTIIVSVTTGQQGLDQVPLSIRYHNEARRSDHPNPPNPGLFYPFPGDK